MAAKNNKNTRKANACKKGPASQKNAGLRIKYDIIAILIVALAFLFVLPYSLTV